MQFLERHGKGRDHMRHVVTILRLAVLPLACAIFYGCATQASLTVTSQPEGAYLTEIDTSKSFGLAPVVVAYDPISLNQYKNAAGCYLVKGFTATWVSGVTTSINPIQLCGTPAGSYTINLSRDPSLPGLEKDLQFVIQLQTLRAQQQQAKAASDASAAALWSAWSSTQQKSIQCTTNVVGNAMQTNCR